MPTYQYRCDKCGKKLERTETIAEHEALKLKCPKCGSNSLDAKSASARKGRAGYAQY